MPTTEHIHLPLYTDEETPDLSTTGHYNHAMEILDANIGELEEKDAELAEGIADEREARIAGDTALDGKVAAETAAREAADAAITTSIGTKADSSALEKEVSDRKAADTALGSRIDNAEAEISANSADLTGIKGLTYGEGGQVFLENDNGSYSSPALEEIRHEIEDGQWKVLHFTNDNLNADASTAESIVKNWPKVLAIWSSYVYVPEKLIGNTYYFVGGTGPYVNFASYAYATFAVNRTEGLITGGLFKTLTASLTPKWRDVTSKPFSIIGSGLKVVSNALTVDTTALPSGTEVNSITPLGVNTAPVAHDVSGLAIGNGAYSRSDGLALGSYSYASAIGCIAIGQGDSHNRTTADHNNAVAIGNKALANTAGSVALGANSRTDSDNVVSVGNPLYSLRRRIINVANPTDAQDAATKNYVDTAIAAIPTGGSSAIALIDADTGTAAEIYAAIQSAWPNCVLRHGDALYLPAYHSDFGYSFFGTPYGTNVPGYVVNSAGAEEYNVLHMNGRATWGQIEQS